MQLSIEICPFYVLLEQTRFADKDMLRVMAIIPLSLVYLCGSNSTAGVSTVYIKYGEC